MMNSGFRTAEAEIPTPALAVPYAAPKANNTKKKNQNYCFLNIKYSSS